MKKIEYIQKFTVSGKAMRLIMEIAAALERCKIVMEGPDGVRLRKLNSGDRNRRVLPKGVKAWSVRRGFAGTDPARGTFYG